MKQNKKRRDLSFLIHFPCTYCVTLKATQKVAYWLWMCPNTCHHPPFFLLLSFPSIDHPWFERSWSKRDTCESRVISWNLTRGGWWTAKLSVSPPFLLKTYLLLNRMQRVIHVNTKEAPAACIRWLPPGWHRTWLTFSLINSCCVTSFSPPLPTFTFFSPPFHWFSTLIAQTLCF